MGIFKAALAAATFSALLFGVSAGAPNAGLPKPPAPSAKPPTPSASPDTADLPKAIFAGGSFWALAAAFESLPGVEAVTAGYTGGTEPNPGFEAVSEGRTGHCEAVEVRYHPKRVRYRALLDAYWRNIDPTSADRQFSDSGAQFRPVIFYGDSAQKREAEASLHRLAASGRFKKPIAAKVEPAAAFVPAESRHQQYAARNPARYHTYLRFSGREAGLRALWGGGAADAKAGLRQGVLPKAKATPVAPAPAGDGPSGGSGGSNGYSPESPKASQ